MLDDLRSELHLRTALVMHVVARNSLLVGIVFHDGHCDSLGDKRGELLPLRGFKVDKSNSFRLSAAVLSVTVVLATLGRLALIVESGGLLSFPWKLKLSWFDGK